MPEPLPSYKEWRVGPPPHWDPTHANAYDKREIYYQVLTSSESKKMIILGC